MKKFLGMPVFNKELSDSEFVERIRKSLRLRRKLAWFHLALFVAMAVFVPMLVRIAWQMIDNMPSEAQKLTWVGLFLGFTFGALAGGYLATALESVVRGFNLFDCTRSERLLIKYHDALSQIADEQRNGGQTHGGATSDVAPDAEGSMNGVVAGGRWRIEAPPPEQMARIRAEVEIEYAVELREAGFLKRIMLRLKIRQEIKARAGIPSKHALFSALGARREPKSDSG